MGLADMFSRTLIITNARISDIFGQKRVEGIEISHKNGQKQLVECDNRHLYRDWIPENEIARLGDLQLTQIRKDPKSTRFSIVCKGCVCGRNLLRGVATADACAIEGRRVAQALPQAFSLGILRQ